MEQLTEFNVLDRSPYISIRRYQLVDTITNKEGKRVLNYYKFKYIVDENKSKEYLVNFITGERKQITPKTDSILKDYVFVSSACKLPLGIEVYIAKTHNKLINMIFLSKYDAYGRPTTNPKYVKKKVARSYIGSNIIHNDKSTNKPVVIKEFDNKRLKVFSSNDIAIEKKTFKVSSRELESLIKKTIRDTSDQFIKKLNTTNKQTRYSIIKSAMDQQTFTMMYKPSAYEDLQEWDLASNENGGIHYVAELKENGTLTMNSNLSNKFNITVSLDNNEDATIIEEGILLTVRRLVENLKIKKYNTYYIVLKSTVNGNAITGREWYQALLKAYYDTHEKMFKLES